MHVGVDSMHNQIVTIDGTDYQLSDFPDEFVEGLELVADDIIEELEGYARTPEQCPTTMLREWHHNSVALVNGGAALPRRLGIAYEFAVGIDPLGGYIGTGNRNDRFEEDETICHRLNWITENARGPYTVWWHRRDTGDGILLDNYEYQVIFHNQNDDAAFLAAFPGAGA